ncbi:MAG: division/cell wall cluster transcriptional repressor MraZ [Chloroflexota bacterium]
MFLGRFQHSIDDKGRLTVPARFRDQLALEGGYVMQGFDRNLMVLTSAHFEVLSRQISAMSMTDPDARQLRRLLFSTSERVEIDRAGRILLPQFLRQLAGLDGMVLVVGLGDYFEIWAPESWEPQDAQLQDAQSNGQRFKALDLSSGA